MTKPILDQLVIRLDELLKKGIRLLGTSYTTEHWPLPYVEEGLFQEWRTGSLAYLRRVFASEHTYPTTFLAETTEHSRSCTVRGQSILSAAREDLLGGHLRTLDSLVTADVFGDFLGMAEYLLTEGFKDSAAVMSGGVLEEQLRKLCRAHNVAADVTDRGGRPIPKKAELMNADLAKAGVYGGIDQKAVTSWLGIRNSAAHGNYSEFSAEQVRLMHQGILGFISRISH